MNVKFFLPLFFVICVGCPQKDDDRNPCEDVLVPITSLEAEYGCTNTAYETEINLDDTFTVIRSQEVFDVLVSGTCTPTIDFNTYDLIIGKQGLRNGNISISYEFIRDCETNLLTLSVTFLQNMTLEAPNLTYHVLTEKIADIDTLEIEIIEIN